MKTEKNALLTLATEMSVGDTLEPAADFAQRLRHQLLDKFPAQAHRTASTHRLAWTTFTFCILIAGIAATFMFQKPTPTKVLARTIDAIAIEPGQIIYQIYTSHNGLYQEWQRVDVTAQNRIIAVEGKVIRYATSDTNFTHPQEWVYDTPEKFCYLSRDTPSIRYPEPDEEGCVSRDSTDQSASPLAPFAGEDLRQRLERLQTNPGGLTIEETTFDERAVYALTDIESDPGPGLRIFTTTLYIDTTTYLPAGYAYTLESQYGQIYEWQTTVLDYQILDPIDLALDPFVWPPPNAPHYRTFPF